MHKSFLPLGPFLHSGLWVTPQLLHFGTPTGGLPAPLPPLENESFDARRVVALEDAGTPSSLGAGVLEFTGVPAGDALPYWAPEGGKEYPPFCST